MVLLAVLALVLMALSGVLLVGLRSAALSQVRADDTTTQALNEAREALIGWAVANPDFPGGLPMPDRDGDGDYDGFSDCLPTNTTVKLSHGLGRLPWRGIPANNAAACSLSSTVTGGLSSLLRDGSGEPLWYAVAPALLRGGNVDATGTRYLDPQVDWSDLGANAWLTVRGADGTVLSDRVAFIVIAPGPPVYRGDLGGTLLDRIQDRDDVGLLPAANDYLDRYTVGGTTYDNADADGDFILAPQNTRDQEDAPSGTADGFNDRLVYVTADELLPLVAARVLDDVATTLAFYYDNNNDRYPWPVIFDDPAVSNFKSNEQGPPPYDPDDQRVGLLPLHIPAVDGLDPQTMTTLFTESISTPFTVTWSGMTPAEATVTTTGVTTAASVAAGSVSFPVTGPSSCLWLFDYNLQCTTGAGTRMTQSVTAPATAPWGSPCTVTECRREVTLVGGSVVVESRDVPGTGVRAQQDNAASAAGPSTRYVQAIKPRTPATTFFVQIDDIECEPDCATSETTVGTATVTVNNATDAVLRVDDVYFELGVVDQVVYGTSQRFDLPQWFVTAGWYQRIVMAVAEGFEPGGDGSCTAGTDCLEVETLDAFGNVVATATNVRALLVFGGDTLPGQVAALLSDPDEMDTYFEEQNDDDDDDFTRASSPAALAALADPVDTPLSDPFNDQVRLVSCNVSC